LVIKPLEPDLIRIGIQPKMLDPDPDSFDPDPKHCCPAHRTSVSEKKFDRKWLPKILPIELRMLAGQGGAEAGRQHPARHARQLLPRDVLLHLSRQLEMLEDGRRVEQEVARLPEDECQLLIVVGHHLGLEDLLAERHQAVDVLDGLVVGDTVIFTN
jgi:hypothetical protein